MNNVQLIEQHYKESFNTWVKRVARRVPGIMDAEDVVQEAFVRALMYQHTFDSRIASFDTWFSNIVNNVHRRMKRSDFLSCEIQEGDWYTREADDYEDDEFTCEQIKTRIAETKNDTHRNILFSHFIVGNKVGQVAHQMGIPVETIKTVVKRFKMKVAERYEI